jgi:hypothetical protein
VQAVFLSKEKRKGKPLISHPFLFPPHYRFFVVGEVIDHTKKIFFIHHKYTFRILCVWPEAVIVFMSRFFQALSLSIIIFYSTLVVNNYEAFLLKTYD